MIDDLQGLWNNLINLIGQIIAPDWGVVISWVPYLLVLLVLVGLAFLALRWTTNRVWTASRLPARRTTPPTPAGMHMPGPSPWPFVAPIGAAIMLLGLVWKTGRVEPPTVDPTTGAIKLGQAPGLTDLFNLPVLLVGLLVVIVGIVGWYRDARHEWVRVEHGHAEAEPIPAEGSGELVLPPGVHLPGPSPWPLFVPVGAAVALLGLVLSPALIGGGVLMAVLAIVGWYLDARHEYEFVAAGSMPEPRTRDPERAFPKALAGTYVAIGLISVMLAATPSILTSANAQPSASPSAAASGGGAAGAIALDAKDIKFEQTTLTAPAGKSFTVTLTNHDSVVHNFAILKPGGGPSDFLFNGQPLTQGGQSTTYSVPALPAGTYTFICIVHPTQMTGTLTIK
ncbi:MAG TPA: cupredoxin domain-containing protein [Candidatus Sulfotelmatobacter sp.]|nr:cupredoxin domain-containing protein [Candidatus Sulfotelmatobacter sp.]